MLPTSMFAMTVNPSGRNLLGESKPVPQATEYDVVVCVLACGLCRTDLHIIDGDLPLRRANLVPGHEVVGQVVAQGPHATRFAIGQRVGIPWLGGTCGFAPVGALVPAALAATRKGGTVVCAGIHMSTIPAFDYRLLWGERVLRSVANLTRQDGDAFFSLVSDFPVQTHVQTFALQDANAAVQAVRDDTLNGAAVLLP